LETSPDASSGLTDTPYLSQCPNELSGQLCLLAPVHRFGGLVGDNLAVLHLKGIILFHGEEYVSGRIYNIFLALNGRDSFSYS
jgi:hypothetical protein